VIFLFLLGRHGDLNGKGTRSVEKAPGESTFLYEIRFWVIRNFERDSSSTNKYTRHIQHPPRVPGSVLGRAISLWDALERISEQRCGSARRSIKQ
jgi:hypothetical protein